MSDFVRSSSSHGMGDAGNPQLSVPTEKGIFAQTRLGLDYPVGFGLCRGQGAEARRQPRCRVIALFPALLGTILLMLAPVCFGQQLTGTLSGTIYDSSGAVVPQATVTMRNVASGDTRTSLSNDSGYFTIAAVQPGTYDITVSAKGFRTWQQKAIVFNLGDNRSLAGVKLEVGAASETLEVSSTAVSVPLDNGEISTTLSQRFVEDIPLVGRDAGELLRVMPGMAFTNGLTQGGSFNDQVVGTNNGPVGSFSSNGTQPNGAIAFMLDGANLVDPGNMGTQIANINQDMVSEVKVLTNDYSAEYAKGPTIFQAFSKSGGTQYHGEGYWYGRNAALNSNDSYNNAQKVPRQDSHFNYVGGNVGGPLVLPHVNFNRDRKKVFFWGGFEYMQQQPAATPVFYNVPTAAQLNGDFSNTGVPQGAINQWPFAYGTPYNPPAGWNASTKTFPTSAFDPNILGLVNLFKTSWAPNVTPTAANGWNNFQYINASPQNRWEATGKVDYAFSDNTKLTVSYSRQDETDLHPVSLWWAPPWTLPYPSGAQAAEISHVVMTNFTHVFNPTTTNEFVFNYAQFINPDKLTNASAASRSTLGFNTPGLFGHTAKQMPNINGPWGGSFPYIINFSFDGGFNGGNTFGGLKKDPSLYDNFSKVIQKHTLKGGVYWDTSENIQSTGGLQASDIGAYNFGWGGNDTGNVVADFLTGNGFTSYQQQSAIPVNDAKYHQWSVYAQDTFQMTKRLTVNYGLRMDHQGQWYGPSAGGQVWNPALYSNSATAPPNTGLLWHGINSSIPQSGFSSRVLYPEPRASLAYDVFGNGKSVLRGGFAVFRYQISTEVLNAFGGPQGAFTFTSPGFGGGYGAVSQFTPPSSVAQNGSTIYVIQPDNQTPIVKDWNVSYVSSGPWRSVFEISYIGNKSRNLYIDGTNGNLNNINNVLPGRFFSPDPKTGVLLSPGTPPCSSSNPDGQSIYCQNNPNYKTTLNDNDYRPLANYQNVYLLTHQGYANYNSLQASWQKQVGSFFWLANYTFSKALGIWDWTSNNGAAGGNTVDPFSLRNNYGPLAYDHTDIFNLSYSYLVPKLFNGFLGQAVNGWRLSGYTTYQSGAPIQPNTELNITWPGGLTVPTVGLPNLPDNSIKMPNGLVSTNMNQGTWFGSDAYHYLLPVVVCDPRKGLSGGQYFNPNCFAPPAYGQQGNLQWPYIKGPGFFDTDLAIGKQFRIKESKNLEFRIQATNWINHALPQFGLAGIVDNQLNFTKNTPYTMVDTSGKTVTGTIVSLSPTNTNPLTTGKPEFKTGSRIVTIVAKFNF